MDGVSPNAVMWDFFNGECGGVDGISQEVYHGVQAFPVPFEDQLFLGSVGVRSATYLLHDIQGGLVRQGRVGADGSIHGLGGLQSGCYFLRTAGTTIKVVK
jgi:hypothetical protein